MEKYAPFKSSALACETSNVIVEPGLSMYVAQILLPLDVVNRITSDGKQYGTGGGGLNSSMFTIDVAIVAVVDTAQMQSAIVDAIRFHRVGR